jgi:hypothetical protein
LPPSGSILSRAFTLVDALGPSIHYTGTGSLVKYVFRKFAMGDEMMSIRGYDLLVEMLHEYVEGWKPCVAPGYIERRKLVAKTIRREEVDVVHPRWTSRGEGVGSRRKRSSNRCAVSGLSDETYEAG